MSKVCTWCGKSKPIEVSFLAEGRSDLSIHVCKRCAPLIKGGTALQVEARMMRLAENILRPLHPDVSGDAIADCCYRLAVEAGTGEPVKDRDMAGLATVERGMVKPTARLAGGAS